MFFSNLKNPTSFGSAEDYQRAMLDKMPEGSSILPVSGDGHFGFKRSE